MDKTNDSTREDLPRSADLRPLDAIIADIWQDALRFALDMDGAADRCGRRACRAEGGCRLRWTPGKPLSCGGGVSDETVGTASAAALFAGMMVMRVLHSAKSSHVALWRLSDDG